MKERPILFSTPMVLALLSDKKFQTRRIIKPRGSKIIPLTLEPWIIDGVQETDDSGNPCWIGSHADYPTGSKWFSCGYGKEGDRLWVRETWRTALTEDEHECFAYRATMSYRCNKPMPQDISQLVALNSGWKPSIFMPRKASRLTLEVTSVKAERVEDCSEADALAEGFISPEEFINYFYVLHPEYSGVNPWVWCVAFRRLG